MKRKIVPWIGMMIMGAMLCLGGCNKKSAPVLSQEDVAIEWSKMALYITRYTPANSPTFASRGFGYIGLTMYESVVNGYEPYQSMAGQLNGLGELPKPDAGISYNWVLTLNAAQAAILKNIYLQTSDENKTRIDSLENVVYSQFSSQADKETAERSVAYGRSVANAIFEWSKTDGGHRGYLKNFDKAAQFPTGPGSWQPPLFAQSFSHYPLHPHWGDNRTFLTQNAALPLPERIPYDTVPGSPYYEQFMEVYKKGMELTQQEKETALWWGDDPDVTFTPPGHSYYLATLALEQTRPPLIQCAQVYAQVGMATADAFINCWKWKYHFFSERPNTFIPRVIDPEWQSFWPDPPFPAFPSGHAIQAAASARVLEANFGSKFYLVDKAHEGRERDEVRDTDFTIRAFGSFWEAALETADSRFYGGIHTPWDNTVGLEEGTKIAGNVIALRWKKQPKS